MSLAAEHFVFRNGNNSIIESHLKVDNCVLKSFCFRKANGLFGFGFPFGGFDDMTKQFADQMQRTQSAFQNIGSMLQNQLGDSGEVSTNRDGSTTIVSDGDSSSINCAINRGGSTYMITNNGQNIIVNGPGASNKVIAPNANGVVNVIQYTKESYTLRLTNWKGTITISK